MDFDRLSVSNSAIVTVVVVALLLGVVFAAAGNITIALLMLVPSLILSFIYLPWKEILDSNRAKEDAVTFSALSKWKKYALGIVFVVSLFFLVKTLYLALLGIVG